MKRIVVILGKGCVALILGLMGLWAMAAIFYSNLPGYEMRIAIMVLFLFITAVIFWKVRSFFNAAVSWGGVWTVILIAWLWIPPSNSRMWQPDVALLPSAVIDGHMLTVHNIRHCDYRTETEYSVAYYDKTFDLTKLQGADLFICFWGSPLIAHTIMSFGFEDGQYLCISIETRKEMGEGYSAIKGFFKQYELIYIIGDERDLIRLRTNFRKETVYLYRLAAAPELVRDVLLNYMNRVNQLNRQPEWYNALAQNCTTAIRGHTAPYTQGKLSWKILVNGYLDTLLYQRQVIDTTLPFEQIKAISRINDQAMRADNRDDFSIMIRQGLPKPQARKP